MPKSLTLNPSTLLPTHPLLFSFPSFSSSFLLLPCPILLSASPWLGPDPTTSRDSSAKSEPESAQRSATGAEPSLFDVFSPQSWYQEVTKLKTKYEALQRTQ
ncbi:putative mads box protein, partial [Corchorus capsularis]